MYLVSELDTAMKQLKLVVLFFVLYKTACAQVNLDLTGKPRTANPGFLITQSFNQGDSIWLSLDPAYFDLNDANLPVYVCENKSQDEWFADPVLSDVRSNGAEFHQFDGTSLANAAFSLSETSDLSTFTDDRPGHAFDVVIDTDMNGVLSNSDYIDGLYSAGFYIIGNMNINGPYDVDTALYEVEEFLTFKLWWPEGISEMPKQPLVVFSHGWTHEYWYYESYAQFLASYGYIVMSHRNDVGDGDMLGTETASESTLLNIEELIANQATIAGGALNNKIKTNKIVLTGHSTGGECVVRAFNKLYSGDFISAYFDSQDIALVSSIAPVAWMNSQLVNPIDVNYHVFLGGADTDASGAPFNGYFVPASIYERGFGNKHLTYIHGAGHEDFHDFDSFETWPDALASGPDLIGKEATHTVVRPYFLSLCELYARGNEATIDYLTRNHSEFRPLGIDESLRISSEYKPKISTSIVKIDNFENNSATDLSSEGQNVTNDLSNLFEVEMRDDNGTFNWDDEQWSNGMVRARFDDSPDCAVLTWNENSALVYELGENQKDWTIFKNLGFRACQITRHPFNYTLAGEISFDVVITDEQGNSAAVNTSFYGPIHPPYPRGGGGYGTFCLDPGNYTVTLDGSIFNSEISFEIPGFVSGGSGTYSFEIPETDTCTVIEVLCYDEWGDGWDSGILVIFNEQLEEIGTVDLLDGSEPDIGYGWQNEFYTFKFGIQDFTAGNVGIDLSNLATLSFEFGPSHGSFLGAIGLDDIQLYGGDVLTHHASEDAIVTSDRLQILPNPCSNQFTFTDHELKYDAFYLIHDITGKMIKVGNCNTGTTTIHCDKWAPGLYFVEVKYGAQRKFGKVIVE